MDSYFQKLILNRNSSQGLIREKKTVVELIWAYKEALKIIKTTDQI
jgi:hypothetical protein